MAKKRKAASAPKAEKKSKVKAKTANGGPAPGQAAGTTAGSNVGVRGGIMRTAFAKLWDCDRDIASARAQHIAPIQEERSEIWKTLRGDLDAKAADLSPHYAVYKRDRQLAEIDDEDEAKKSQDLMREAWEALATGRTLNFLDVLGSDAKGAGESEHISTKTARAAGREAGRAGRNADHNPHAHDSDLGVAWEAGRGEGMVDNLPAPGGDPFGPKEEATAH